jgi:hypothetical protein
MEPIAFSEAYTLLSPLRWDTTEKISSMFSVLHACETSGVKLEIESSSGLQEV